MNMNSLQQSQSFFSKYNSKTKIDTKEIDFIGKSIEEKYRKFYEGLDEGIKSNYSTVAQIGTYLDNIINNFGGTVDTALAGYKSCIGKTILYAGIVHKLLKLKTPKKEKTYARPTTVTYDENRKVTNLNGGVTEWSQKLFPFYIVISNVNQVSAFFYSSDLEAKSLFYSGAISIGDCNRAVYIYSTNGTLYVKYELFKEKGEIKIRPSYTKAELKQMRLTKLDVLRRQKGTEPSLESSLLKGVRISN